MQKVKNVLSIDMDYIMAPCINLYNDCAGGEEFQEGDFWDRVNQIRDIDKHLSYDENKFLFLVEILATQLKRLDTGCFLFAEEHDMILEMLCGKDKADEVYNIYNIDHHHDIFYDPRQKDEVDRFDFACLANWVYYLGKNEKINKYFWVRNENSAPFPREEISGLTFPVDFNSYVTDLAPLIHETSFDYVFVCRSSEYFPKKYNHLFDVLFRMACCVKNHNFAVWDTPYCVDGKSRHINW